MAVTDKLSKRDRQLAEWFAREGFEHPLLTVAAFRHPKADLKPQTAAALLSMETGDGSNVFGHDHGSNLPDRPPYSGHRVTETRARRLFDSEFSNGVGPCQLTSKSLVAIARRRGGEWRPYWNMVTGFEHVGQLIRAHGIEHGAARYNGGDSSQGQANGATYGRNFERKREEFTQKLRRAGFHV